MSYSLTEEFQIFLKQKIATGGESVEFEEVVACRLRDIKQSRFGKMFDSGNDMAYLFDDMDEFLANHMKDNKLYDTCVLYIKFPFLREISTALAVMNYHFVHPYMRATGIEGVASSLNHPQFMELMPKLIEDLKNSHSPNDKMDRFVPLPSVLENLTAMNSVVKERFASSKVYIFSLIPRRLADPWHMERMFIINYAIIRLCSEYGHVFLDMRPVFRPGDTGPSVAEI